MINGIFALSHSFKKGFGFMGYGFIILHRSKVATIYRRIKKHSTKGGKQPTEG